MTAIMRLNLEVLLVTTSALLLTAASSGMAAQTPSRAKPAPKTLAGEIDKIVDQKDVASAQIGVFVMSLSDGKVLYDRQADKLFMPASALKTVTSAAALDKLGPDYRYHTPVLADAAPDAAGTIKGNLYLKGSGDPVLATEHLRKLAADLKARGVKQIAGDLVCDDSCFDKDRIGSGWSYDYLPWYYAMEVSGLSVNHNAVWLRVVPGEKEGDPATVTMIPQTDYVKLSNEVTTAAQGTRRRFFSWRNLPDNTFQLRGQIALGGRTVTEGMTVTDATLYAATLFREQLAAEGITVTGTVRADVVPAGATELASYESAPMSEIIALLNKPSDNHIAEQLIKTLGATDGSGTWRRGIGVVRSFLRKAGINPDGPYLADGSGLSRLDMIAPRMLAQVLRYMHSHPQAKVYRDSLPIAGVDGSLRLRLRGTPAEKNVYAKPGYVMSVSTLAGYVNDRDGKPLVFAFMANNYLCPTSVIRGMQDGLCTLLASSSIGTGRVARMR